MKRYTVLGWIVVVVLLAFIHQAPAKGGVVALNGGLERSLEEVVLFPYDNYSIPLIYGLELGLIPGEKHKENPIIRMGKPGKPDSKAVAYYGTVIKIGDQLRMWYIGAPEVYDTTSGGWPGWGLGRVCYAVSKDGIQWEKPALGLVEFEGSKQNNLVDLDIDRLRASLVLYEPDDPDPNRRFKMVFESDRYGAKFGVAYSPDGLKWKQSPKNPVGPVFEMAGMVKLNRRLLRQRTGVRISQAYLGDPHLLRFRKLDAVRSGGFPQGQHPPALAGLLPACRRTGSPGEPQSGTEVMSCWDSTGNGTERTTMIVATSAWTSVWSSLRTVCTTANRSRTSGSSRPLRSPTGPTPR